MEAEWPQICYMLFTPSNPRSAKGVRIYESFLFFPLFCPLWARSSANLAEHKLSQELLTEENQKKSSRLDSLVLCNMKNHLHWCKVS